ncbi:hypothetical protein [Sphingobacterium sp. SYP-B4668]|uniref:hypothetical protein n=1 Tax=Sphingobacterium sp. SYP-B4668 TaxID=2996035 RepID=UPI0022DD4E26|nr:hypothetical protein [Sphingobacterium sp. SYP-B4668]
MEIQLRLCQECKEQIRGRSDKRFCDDACRNNYNNKINSDANNYVRQINTVLRKNRRVLEELLGQEDKKKTSRELLLTNGFQFKYSTNQHTTNRGYTYYFVYEYGYLLLEQELVLLVRRRD